MSNTENKAIEQEDFKLNLNRFAIFFIIGYGFRLLGMAYIFEILPIANNDLQTFLNNLPLFLSVGIMFLPMWWNIIRGGFMAILKVPSYAVITTTTYSDGTTTKTSDHGEEAMVTGGILKVIWFVVGYFLAAFATLAIIGFQIFTFVTKFNRVKNKWSYLVTVVALGAYLLIGPSIAMKLAPVFDKKHFDHAEIAKAIETSQKNLYSGNFSFSIVKDFREDKSSYIANIAYTKATDTTFIDISLANERKYKGSVQPGKYTFTGNALTNSEISSNRKMGNAAIAEVTNLLPVNLIFKRLSDDKKRLRMWDFPNPKPGYNVNLGNPEGTNKKKRQGYNFLRTENDYKLWGFWAEPYMSSSGLYAEISYE
jgi:hypothetical protein